MNEPLRESFTILDTYPGFKNFVISFVMTYDSYFNKTFFAPDIFGERDDDSSFLWIYFMPRRYKRITSGGVCKTEDSPEQKTPFFRENDDKLFDRTLSFLVKIEDPELLAVTIRLHVDGTIRANDEAFFRLLVEAIRKKYAALPKSQAAAGPDLSLANQWLIEQYFEVHKEKAKLPLLSDEWLKKRAELDMKPPPSYIADSMRQVIRQERKRRSMNIP